ncbi:MAG: IS256 family transposase [Acidobacteriota bacterium]|nr:IS256 family transposase [Acidobacteriota bacterium]
MAKEKAAKVVSDELIDEWLKEGRKPEDVHGLLKQITKAVVERAMQGEMTRHLGYTKHDPAGNKSGNSRNGVTRKTLKGDFGEVEVETPRDRNGQFEPQFVKKNQTRWTGFDDKILSMYSRGMSTRDIQGHLEEMYQVEVSPSLISEVTDSVIEDARAWQNRPLEPFYGIVFLDALYVKMRREGRVENRAVYVAIGIDLEGRKDVLGLWTSANEGAKFWLSVLTELRNRGVRDVYVVCVDGLKGFPQAIETIFPSAQVQLCIVHMVRASLNYATWQDRRKVVADLKPIYRATTADEAERQLTEFESNWPKYPAIARLWRENWERLIPFFAFPAEVRKIVYTTNAVESLHMSLRKIIKTRGSFPTEEAATKLLYLALARVVAKWQTVQNWKQMLNFLETMCGDRIRAAGVRQ